MEEVICFETLVHTYQIQKTAIVVVTAARVSNPKISYKEVCKQLFFLLLPSPEISSFTLEESRSGVPGDVTCANILPRAVYLRVNPDEFWTFMVPLVCQR
jgi:hypothetical protein